MSNTQATVRAFSHRTASPAEMCAQLNRIVAENMSSGKFITMFYGVLDTARHKLRYTNAGHIPPVLIRKDGSLERLGEGGIVLGVLTDATYEEVEVSFAPGDRLVLFTDGITEANDTLDDEFGMERLTELLLLHRTKPASQMLGAILHEVGQFTSQGFQDDATVLIITME